MQFIACHSGKIQHLAEVGLKTSAERSFRTELEMLDGAAPNQSFARGAVHELLAAPAQGQPKFVAAVIARAAAVSNDAPIIWCDPDAELYPPALAAMGVDLSRVYLIHPKSIVDASWAVAECLRCRGVGAVVASFEKLSHVEARRLQLAAEAGSTVGIFMRPFGAASRVYAAATRWLVAPHPGERTVQRWTIQLLHGHGGRVGETVFLEHSRETNTVRALEKLAARPGETETAIRRAIA